MAERPLDSAIRKAMLEDHKVKPDYSRIRVPVLAIYRTTTLEQVDLRDGVPHARIVELPGANLYMFLSNEADVIHQLRAFAATLPR